MTFNCGILVLLYFAPLDELLQATGATMNLENQNGHQWRGTCSY
jgi:hypothetical protein